MAQVGSDRLDEIENPELATQRTRELYKLKGYPDDWIEKRMRSRSGQGTGLGLSLSYDIVKAHGGELKVETKEAEGREFIILQLTT